jgi:hypothetical protein
MKGRIETVPNAWGVPRPLGAISFLTNPLSPEQMRQPLSGLARSSDPLAHVANEKPSPRGRQLEVPEF